MRWRGWVLTSLLVMGCLTGCWDQRPIEGRGLVQAIAVAPANQANTLQWTFVFPNPSESVDTLSSLTPGKKNFTISVTAPTWTDALSAMQEHTPRDLYFGQLRLLVLSSRFSTEQWGSLLTDLNRSGRVLKTFRVADADDPAAVVAKEPPSEGAPIYPLYRLLSCKCQPYDWDEQAWQIWSRFVTPGISPIIPVVTLQQAHLSISHLAVLGSQRPIAWSPNASAGWAYLTGQVAKGSLSVRLPDGTTVGLGRIRGVNRLKIVPDGNQHLTVRDTLSYRGSIVEVPPDATITAANIRSVEQAAEQTIRQWSQTAIAMAEQQQVDPFGWHRDWRWADVGQPANSLSRSYSWNNFTVILTVKFHVEQEGIAR